MKSLFCSVIFSASLFACSDVDDDHDHHHDHEQELITTVELTLTAEGSEESVTYRWADPENDGEAEIDELLLESGVTYTVNVAFLNEMEEPAEDITPEILDEADQHQVFFTGEGLLGPAEEAPKEDATLEHIYLDEDEGGLPLGLENQLVALELGSDSLQVTLRHLPLENETATKTEALAETVAVEGFAGIGGDSDALVLFPYEVVEGSP